MINTTVDIDSIIFEEEDPGILLDSIEKRGIAIPVHVNKTETGYVCTDGRKRLTACRILSKNDIKLRRIPILIMNDYSLQGNAFWGSKNHH
jgi:ParB-like chromosome segregation protein Spo0J